MSSWTLTTYKIKNWVAYNRASKQRGSLSLRFHAAMDWGAAPSAKQGRQQAYSDAAISGLPYDQCAVRFTLAANQGFVESLLQLLGLNWLVPKFGTLFQRQKTKKIPRFMRPVQKVI